MTEDTFYKVFNKFSGATKGCRRAYIEDNHCGEGHPEDLVENSWLTIEVKHDKWKTCQGCELGLMCLARAAYDPEVSEGWGIVKSICRVCGIGYFDIVVGFWGEI